jgi:hypothetical protein
MNMPQGFDVVLDDILEGVAKNGSHEIEWVILLNTAFRSDASKPSPSAQLNTWAKENNLRYDSNETQHGKKKATLITFYRR